MTPSARTEAEAVFLAPHFVPAFDVTGVSLPLASCNKVDNKSLQAHITLHVHIYHSGG